MTTEIAILNASAAALAADSAVSVSGAGDKIYDSESKLFELTTRQPIAAMYYGNADLGRLPLETTIREFSRRNERTVFATVDEAARAFRAFLQTYAAHIDPQEADAAILHRAEWEFDSLSASVREATPASGQASSQLLDDCIRQRMADLSAIGTVAGTSSLSSRLALKRAIPNWSSFVKQQLRDLHINLSVKAINSAKLMLLRSLRTACESPDFSGIVIAGFGNDQVFPALTSFVLDGALGKRLRIRTARSIDVAQDKKSRVLSFAQFDVVDAFMSGLDPEMRRYLNLFIPNLAEEVLAEVRHKLGKSYGTGIEQAVQSLVAPIMATVSRRFEEELKLESQNEHINPKLMIVDWLPKRELADMAETLVGLTSFMRKITPQRETVGGPVDVAVISKGDGLIWIKRKQYFPTELNP